MGTLPPNFRRDSIDLPRAIAILLASGGACWGIFLLAGFGPRVLIVPPSAAGFLITAGYWLRAVTLPSMNVRRLIWIASILVQGGWSCIGIADLRVHEPSLFLVWWLCATVASIVALAVECKEDTQRYDDASTF